MKIDLFNHVWSSTVGGTKFDSKSISTLVQGFLIEFISHNRLKLVWTIQTSDASSQEYRWIFQLFSVLINHHNYCFLLFLANKQDAATLRWSSNLQHLISFPISLFLFLVIILFVFFFITNNVPCSTPVTSYAFFLQKENDREGCR